ncbi:MAG: hypothetical protein ABIZ36_09395 [Gemmatimonadaceae bacterium]
MSLRNRGTVPPKALTPEQQFKKSLAEFDAPIQDFTTTCISRMRKRLPRFLELVYDNYNALVVGYGPNERASDALFSIVIFPRYVSIYFITGAALADKDKLLQGTGNVVRHMRLSSPGILDHPDVKALMKQAVDRSTVKIPATQRSQMIIKSISAKRRPRKPSAAARKQVVKYPSQPT